MSVKLLLEYSDFLVLIATCLNLILMWRKRVLKTFAALSAFLMTVIVAECTAIPLLFFRRALGIELRTAWFLYAYIILILSAIQLALMIAIIYNVFHISMRPLPGLQRIGGIVFRWVASVSLVFALFVALGPHLAESGNAIITAVSNILGRVQEGVNILVLCLLLFVCFSTKSLGLTFRSHIFGVNVGLGIVAVVQLVEAAWTATSQSQSVYSPMYLFSNVGTLVAFAVWGIYFAMPEPARKMILLPTTSPFFFWNRLSEALGDAPGHVALSGVRPNAVEMKIMAEMGKRSKERERQAMASAEAREQELMNSTVAS